MKPQGRWGTNATSHRQSTEHLALARTKPGIRRATQLGRVVPHLGMLELCLRGRMKTGVAGVIEDGVVVGAEYPVGGIMHWHSGECTELASNDVLCKMIEICSKTLVSEAIEKMRHTQVIVLGTTKSASVHVLSQGRHLRRNRMVARSHLLLSEAHSRRTLHERS